MILPAKDVANYVVAPKPCQKTSWNNKTSLWVVLCSCCPGGVPKSRNLI